jgi:CBS domain-containing protein
MARSKLLDLRVRDVMSADPLTVTPDDTLGEVLGKMKTHDVHELAVVRGKNLAGLVTMVGIMRRRALPPTTSVATILQVAPEVSPDDDLPSLAERMLQGGFRGVPVCEGKRLVGIVSRTDVAKAVGAASEFKDVTVDAVMTPAPQVATEEETVEQAIRTMQGLGERSLPVVDKKGRLVGVIGNRDITAFFGRKEIGQHAGDVAGEKTHLQVQVKGVMHAPPITVGLGATVAQATQLMVKHDVSSVIVVEKDAPVGVVTKLDLLELVAGLKEREELLVQISGLEEQPEVWDSLYEVIQKAMNKIGQVVTPKSLTVHVQTYKAEGDRSKYSLRARFTTTHRMYYQTHFDWDLHEAMAGLMALLEGQIMKEKERRITDRKRGRNP